MQIPPWPATPHRAVTSNSPAAGLRLPPPIRVGTPITLSSGRIEPAVTPGTLASVSSRSATCRPSQAEASSASRPAGSGTRGQSCRSDQLGRVGRRLPECLLVRGQAEVFEDERLVAVGVLADEDEVAVVGDE